MKSKDQQLQQRIIPTSPIDLVILLFTFGDSITNIIRLDKMIQLLYELGRFPEAFEYRNRYGKLPKYGPFTEDLLCDLTALEECGFIRVDGSTYHPTPFIIALLPIYKITKIQKTQINLVRTMILGHELNTLLKMVSH